MMRLIIFTDGGARGNPGEAGIGVAIYDETHKLLETHKRYIGIKTNNQAEYEAVLLALEKAVALTAVEIDFYLDSELVVKQLSGEYKIKNEGLMPLVQKILSLTNKFSRVSYHHVPRERNQLADKLVNEAIDEGGE